MPTKETVVKYTDPVAEQHQAVHPLTRKLVSTEDWEYIELPEEGIINDFVPDFTLSTQGVELVYTKGTRYFVPPDIAESLKERIKVWKRTELRILHGRDPDVLKKQRARYPDAQPI